LVENGRRSQEGFLVWVSFLFGKAKVPEEDMETTTRRIVETDDGDRENS
jgi:hypothetical protein